MPGDAFSVNAVDLLYENKKKMLAGNGGKRTQPRPSTVPPPPVPPPPMPVEQAIPREDPQVPVHSPQDGAAAGNSEGASEMGLEGPVTPPSETEGNSLPPKPEGPSRAAEEPLRPSSNEGAPTYVPVDEPVSPLVSGNGRQDDVPDEEPADVSMSDAFHESPAPKPSRKKSVAKPKNPVNGGGRTRGENLREAAEVGPDVKTIARVPASVVDYIEAAFPKGDYSTPMKLAAYVYVASGKTCEVPQKAKELAKTWEGVVTTDMLNARLNRLERRMTEMMFLMKESELISTAILFDKFGLRHENVSGPSSFELFEPGFEEFLNKLRNDTKRLKKMEDDREGRVHPNKREPKED